ncbi:MAG: PorT family protein [Bacteroidales bacterium]|nr:PorT family protein [Bacteroidales bacterium]
MSKLKVSLIISFILLWCISQSVKAQQFHGGITAGLVGSQVAGDTYSGYKKGGVYAGGFVSLDVSDRSAFQMELTYFQKGSRENPTEKNNYDFYLFRADYIELPLLYQYKTGKDKKFIIEAGPSMGVLVGYYEEDEREVISDYTDNVPARLTLQFNLGIRWMIAGRFGVDFRTHHSLLNIRTKNVTGDVWRIWTYGQFHDALVLSLFYQIK